MFKKMLFVLTVILTISGFVTSVFSSDSRLEKPKKYLKETVYALQVEMEWNQHPTRLRPGDGTWQEDAKLYNDFQSFLIHNTHSYYAMPTPLDDTWHDWLKRTGELPPDFDSMPSIPLLPDPLIMDEGGKNIPITTKEQWNEQRKWIKEQAQKWMLGTIPPPPDNSIFKVLSEEKCGDVTRRFVEMRFGPDHRATLRLVLMIPPGTGPFPVFLTQYNHQSYTLLALRRGYLTCAFTAADDLDDTEEWAEIYYPEYDFSRLMRRAWAAGRAIDYLETLPYVDKDKIALTGHSRNGKVVLYAAAFEDRITAVMPIGCGSGAETPERYTADIYSANTIAKRAHIQHPNWYHPRFLFFWGREKKLPFDNNSLQALIAPRGLVLSLGINNRTGSWWGTEQSYNSARKVYQLLDAEDNILLRLRDDSEGDENAMEDFIDFCDYIFGRSSEKPPEKYYNNFSFDQWKKLSKENINPSAYTKKGPQDLLKNKNGKKIGSVAGWEQKKEGIKKQLIWALGEEPPGAINPGPGEHHNLTAVLNKSFDSRGNVVPRIFSEHVGEVVFQDMAQKAPSSQFHSFSDHQSAKLFYPIDEEGKLKGENLPVVIYLHEYGYACGSAPGQRSIIYTTFHKKLVENGVAVFIFDFIGFGSRIKQGTRFYNRYPNWSRMGRMVEDVKAAVDALQNIRFIDKDNIYVAGYALGGTVSLYAAALDDRITGAASVCGFTPLRLSGLDQGVEGLFRYSHLHGLLPRLGFFLGQEKRLPFDFDEIVASVAPRPVFIGAPKWDQYVIFSDVEQYIDQVRKVYKLYNSDQNIEFYTPDNFNRFTVELQNKVIEWVKTICN